MKFKFAAWQFFLLQGIAGATLKDLNYPGMNTWAAGLVTGAFLTIGTMVLVEHYIEWKKEAKA